MKLNNDQYNVLNTITRKTKTDCWFYLMQDEYGNDYVRDLEFRCNLTLKEAIEQLNEAIIPKLLNLTNKEIETYSKLLEILDIKDNPFLYIYRKESKK